MFLITVTLALILIGFAAFVYGTIALSKFAFRVSTGRGIAALLFPPYTLYFTFSELDEEEKAMPAASWAFGILVTTLLLGVFAQPLGHLANGRWDQLQATSPGEAASAKHGNKVEEDEDDESGAEDDEAKDDSDSEESEGAADEDEEASGDDEESADEGDKADEESADGDKEGDDSDE